MGHESLRHQEDELFGTLQDGTEIPRIMLTAAPGEPGAPDTRPADTASLTVIPYGATLVDLRVPDRNGAVAPVVLGYSSLEEYVQSRFYPGATVGRIAGRLTAGRLVVDGEEYQLACNDPPNHLHGGVSGFSRKVWTVAARAANSVTFTLHDPAGEQGYPGTVDVEVEYRLTPVADASVTPAGADTGTGTGTGTATDTGTGTASAVDLVITTRARTDAPTPLSTTNHAYFNLSGGADTTIDDHLLTIHADTYVPADEHMTLAGTVVPLEGTAADLRKPRRLGDVIPALHRMHGDNYILRGEASAATSGSGAGGPTAGGADAALRHVARAVHPGSGRVMDTLTDAGSLQFFGGHYLESPLAPRAGFCLECQGYPDGPNHPEIEDIILRPGELYSRTIVYRFYAQ